MNTTNPNFFTHFITPPSASLVTLSSDSAQFTNEHNPTRDFSQATDDQQYQNALSQQYQNALSQKKQIIIYR